MRNRKLICRTEISFDIWTESKVHEYKSQNRRSTDLFQLKKNTADACRCAGYLRRSIEWNFYPNLQKSSFHFLLQEGPAPPAPPPMDVRRRKRDLSNHRISKRHVREGPSRRQKRQAQTETRTAHQMMSVIEKVSDLKLLSALSCLSVCRSVCLFTGWKGPRMFKSFSPEMLFGEVF